MRRRALIVVLMLVAAVTLGCFGGGSDGEEPTPTATSTTRPVTTPAPSASPTGQPSPAAPTTQPSPAATAASAPTRAPGTVGSTGIEGDPFSSGDLEAALPSPGLALSDEFEPECPGASAPSVVFTGPDGASSEKHAVWVLWVYPGRDAFEADWAVGEDFRMRSLLDGCEPPNGFVYWHENLVLWFAGYYGSEVAPGSLPATGDEIRGHPVVRTFLDLTWQ